GHARDAEALPACHVRGDGRLLRRPEAADGVPVGAAERGRRRAQSDPRGADRVLLAVRAPRAPVPRLGPRRVRRKRRDPRHLEAHTPRASVRAPVHRAGAARRADRRHARRARRGARRRRASRGCAPLHADARRRGGGIADGDHLLAGPLRRGREPAARVPRRGAHAPHTVSLELLWEREGLPAGELPEALQLFYAGGLALEPPCVYANFVETIDGIVAIPEHERSNALVADESDDDKHVMGMLRAFADCVLIGSGTLLASPKGRWRPEGVYPAAAAAFAELRSRLGKPEHPAVAVVTTGASLDTSHRVLEHA